MKFLEAIERKINDTSRGNILIHTLNVVKAACLIIELLMKVRSQFPFMSRRVEEIKQKIVSIAAEFMDQVNTEEEMRFLLLSPDLDQRDALNVILDYNIVELLEKPFAHSVVMQIWGSPYNNSSALTSVSTIHTLFWNYNHCQFD